ncbi:MAG: molybdopterin-dependent oxidoreductase [Coriobacteriia bacterium]|nr:molybdopterin-dependent oxidoreductase [Coriobacteriia bacterium]MBS5478082.1 molybdopterin-dependent oxidoreductase [Coriobacteriia bacterium]
MQPKKSRRATLALALCLAATLGLGGASAASAAEESPSGEDVYTVYAPEVTRLADGTLVQRTPTEGDNHTTLDTSYTYHLPEENVPYNTYYLKADARGCNSCHPDLAELLNTMTYSHVDITNDYGIQTTVQMCIDCHTSVFSFGYITNQESFGSLIHGIHSTGQADCWNCHVATGSGDGMQLWDEAKHDQLRGIVPIADVQGVFSYDQDLTTPIDSVFDFDWNSYDLDYLRHDKTAENAPLDKETFDSWTITVTDLDGKTTTWTLPDIIEQFDSVTLPLKMHCVFNPTGGPLISNAVYTGVPLSALLEAAGIDPDSKDFGGVQVSAPDGFTGTAVKDKYYSDVYLCYEIDGEPLPWAQGYPVQVIVPHAGAGQCVKQVSDISVLPASEDEEDSGSGGYQPIAGIFNFSEGQVIQTGQPYEFSGYADAMDQKIVAVEFSMDGGATWTRFDTSDSTPDNWVIWHFSFTPETDAAYVLSVRCESESGLVTEEPVEIMFNATSDMSAIEENAA